MAVYQLLSLLIMEPGSEYPCGGLCGTACGLVSIYLMASGDGWARARALSSYPSVPNDLIRKTKKTVKYVFLGKKEPEFAGDCFIQVRRAGRDHPEVLTQTAGVHTMLFPGTRTCSQVPSPRAGQEVTSTPGQRLREPLLTAATCTRPCAGPEVGFRKHLPMAAALSPQAPSTISAW